MSLLPPEPAFSIAPLLNHRSAAAQASASLANPWVVTSIKPLTRCKGSRWLSAPAEPGAEKFPRPHWLILGKQLSTSAALNSALTLTVLEPLLPGLQSDHSTFSAGWARRSAARRGAGAGRAARLAPSCRLSVARSKPRLAAAARRRAQPGLRVHVWVYASG